MPKVGEQDVPPVARAIAARFAARSEVVAVAVAGSRATGVDDRHSDIDLYVYADPEVPVAARAALADEFGVPGWRDIDNRFWGPGDEWSTGSAPAPLGIDLMYFTPGWIADRLDRVLVRHEASLGYSTCFWHTVRQSLPLFDRDGWFARVKAMAAVPYPEPLRRAIVAYNHPPLRATHSSLMQQLERAVERGDRVSVQHRLTAMLASYFDILFAVNRQAHPGEKRLVAQALARCSDLPATFPDDLDALLASPPGPETVRHGHALLDGLDDLLAQQGLGQPSGRGQ